MSGTFHISPILVINHVPHIIRIPHSYTSQEAKMRYKEILSNGLTNHLNRTNEIYGEEIEFKAAIWDSIAQKWHEFKTKIPVDGTDHMLSLAERIEVEQRKSVGVKVELTTAVWAMAVQEEQIQPIMQAFNQSAASASFATDFWLLVSDFWWNEDGTFHTGPYLLAYLSDGKTNDWLIAKRV